MESLRETLLEDHGRDADYFDVAAAAERYAPDDPTLIAEVMTHWDDQPSSLIADDLFAAPDENFGYTGYYERTTGI